MIYGLLSELSSKIDNYPNLKNAVSFLSQLLRKSNLSNGKYVWDSERPEELFANVQTYQSRPFDVGIFESHKKYIDLQYVVSGEEYLYIPSAPADSLKEEQAYSEENDCALQQLLPEPECTRILLTPDNFAVLFPDEAHAPGIATANGKTEIQKIVIKIKHDF